MTDLVRSKLIRTLNILLIIFCKVVDATKLCQISADKNGIAGKITFAKLDWNKLDTVPAEGT